MKRRIKINIVGAVQGVGFRPFIYRLANELSLAGFVKNNMSGVHIESEGEKDLLEIFLIKIQKEKPKRAIITSLEYSLLDEIGYKKFEIIQSEALGELNVLIQPDIAPCEDCLREMFEPGDRRYLYPFTNCANCGPRYSIIESLPYDRPNTSMKYFLMCEECKSEYGNPNDRRYHAQPVACAKCGPKIELYNSEKINICQENEAVIACVEKIQNGKIVALKGVGGFQLICDCSNEKTVSELRSRKHREAKPFAIMFPNIEMIKEQCALSELEERLIRSAEAPIVLLKRKSNSEKVISKNVAPGNPYLAVMLPSSPLHHLLMRRLNKPIIATSGNLSEEPICISNNEAFERLKNISDFFLIHNREIVRHVDDSIVKIILGRETIIRRARGYAPLPLTLEIESSANFLSVGGHLKNTIAVSKAKNVFVSQHIGDLSTNESFSAFQKTIGDLQTLLDLKNVNVLSDLHPEYISTKYAKQISSNVHAIQHHIAHAAACKIENQIIDDALAVVWDGTGYGLDGTIWGGEFFINRGKDFLHAAQLKQFHIPGGDVAIKEPRRSAAGILFSIDENLFDEHLQNNFSEEERKSLSQALQKKINSPLTSSAGRLFDAVASILGLKQKNNFEGEAAMALEFVSSNDEFKTYPFVLIDGKVIQIDCGEMIKEIFSDLTRQVDISIIASKFHSTLAEIIAAVSRKIGIKKILLSGGCFQNSLLLQRTVARLESHGFTPYWHQRVPTNDGGISFGQIAFAIMNINQSKIEKQPANNLPQD